MFPERRGVFGLLTVMSPGPGKCIETYARRFQGQLKGWRADTKNTTRYKSLSRGDVLFVDVLSDEAVIGLSINL